MRPADIQIILEQEFLSVAEGHHTPVMLWGAPGVGKSQMIAQIGARHGAPVVDIRLSQMEPSDLRGIPFRSGDLVEWAVPALLPDAERHGARGILFLDEITSASPTVSAAAYQLILDRRLGEYQVPDGWAIFAAGNRQGDRGVVYAMPSPLANRFSHLTVDVNIDDWAAWAFQAGMEERLIAFLRFRPELLFDFDPAQNPVVFPTPRSWEFAHRALRKFEGTPRLLPALQSVVGEAAGVEFKAYLDNLGRLPDLDAILRGEGAEVADEIDLQYAVAAALIARSARLSGAKRREALGHVLDYAGRFPLKEMGVMLVSDLSRTVGGELFDLPQFEGWSGLVADVLLFTH